MARMRLLPALACATALAALPPPCDAEFAPFGTVTLTPDFELNGVGTNMDSIAFFEAPNPADTLLFVTAKGNQRVEVWRFPFLANQQPALVHASFGVDPTHVNGVLVDPATDRLYVSVGAPESTVSVFSLPGLAFLGEFINGALNLKTEPNLALLHRPDGARWLYVSADTVVYVRDAQTGAAIGQWNPSTGLETMVADDPAQVIYIPDETGRTGVYAYEPLGAPHLQAGTNHFGAGVFDADAEGIVLYHCPAHGPGDDGSGLLVVADQRVDFTQFEFFDRRTWAHLGALVLTGVSNTDGIGSTQRPLAGWPDGLFAAIDNNATTALIGWDRILAATGLACPVPAAPALAPASRGLLALALVATAFAPSALRRRA